MTAMLALRALLSGIIITIVSVVSRRYPALGALVASLPLISVLSMIWLWNDRPDAENMARHAEATFYYVLPSLPMFLLIPALLRRGISFPAALIAGCVATILLYLATVAIVARMGIRL
ncbi:putative membrane protein [Sphingobium herbicidovorans NBRC 16415]|uniref:Membrane protein n=1 Tax=Sphingobium herbicidovorans (strain ATCC 700291 / DSM 11019 / CCUG 56400 / KCTC 2939 / LMG 18315 / NBRC 16415 / MH) TaxID=1219045 RepID=A0A086PCQ9_SPHHM|nr:putative membrane protein [Sphingobium herbicidovorans NBRC 16415]